MNTRPELAPQQAPTQTNHGTGESGFCCGDGVCALLLIVLGALFLANTLDIFPYGFYLWRFWPVILIAAGVWILWKRTNGVPASRQEGEPR